VKLHTFLYFEVYISVGLPQLVCCGMAVVILLDHLLITFLFLSCWFASWYNSGNFGPWLVRRKVHTPVFSWTQESNFLMFIATRESWKLLFESWIFWWVSSVLSDWTTKHSSLWLFWFWKRRSPPRWIWIVSFSLVFLGMYFSCYCCFPPPNSSNYSYFEGNAKLFGWIKFFHYSVLLNSTNFKWFGWDYCWHGIRRVQRIWLWWWIWWWLHWWWQWSSNLPPLACSQWWR